MGRIKMKDMKLKHRLFVERLMELYYPTKDELISDDELCEKTNRSINAHIKALKAMQYEK